MALSKERRGEIALALVKNEFRRNGVRLSSNSRRELGVTAKDTGIPVEDLEEFILEVLPEMIGDAFGYSRVSLKTEGRREKSQVTSGNDHHSCTF
jgi:hypothetical protein